MDEPLLITIAQCAWLLGFTPKHIYALIRNNPTFPRPLKFGRCTRLVLSEVRAWVAANAQRDAQLRSRRVTGGAREGSEDGPWERSIRPTSTLAGTTTSRP